MNPISEQTVEATWEELVNLIPEQAESLIEEIKEEQPLLLAYLLAAEDELFDQDSREFILFYGIVIWKVMLQGGTALSALTEDVIEEAEEANFKLLDEYDEELEADFESLSDCLLDGYNQESILRAVSDAIADELEEASDPINESQELILIYLKTVIDCLDR